jgi:hypothetical protein
MTGQRHREWQNQWNDNHPNTNRKNIIPQQLQQKQQRQKRKGKRQ